MQTLVINTQHRENYGAHDWDGKGECPQHWKYKGGTTYFVTGLTGKQINKIAHHGIPTLSKMIESKNEMFEEYILDWEIRDLGKNGDGRGPNGEPGDPEFYWGGDLWLCRNARNPHPNILAGTVPSLARQSSGFRSRTVSVLTISVSTKPKTVGSIQLVLNSRKSARRRRNGSSKKISNKQVL